MEDLSSKYHGEKLFRSHLPPKPVREVNIDLSGNPSPLALLGEATVRATLSPSRTVTKHTIDLYPKTSKKLDVNTADVQEQRFSYRH